MSVDKLALFARTAALWPSKVDVRADPNATNEIYQQHERATPVTDDWSHLALWAFHQALANHEKQAIAKGIHIIFPREVTFPEFDFWMRANLNRDACWANERVEYETTAPDQ